MSPGFKDRQTDLGRRVSSYQPRMHKSSISDEAFEVPSDMPFKQGKPRRRMRFGKVIVLMVFVYALLRIIGSVFEIDAVSVIRNIVTGG